MYIKRPSEHSREHRPKPSDRRTVKRRHLIFYLRVWEIPGDRLLGHVVDITPEGMMLISDQPIDTGKELSLEARLPDTDGDLLKPLHFRAICRWSDNDVNTAFYDSGLEFLDRSPEDVESIKAIIETYGFQD